jgi:hypothetical protein
MQGLVFFLESSVAEKQRIKVPPDNYGRLYVGLLETKLSAYAKLCFGVMWSFGGAESWASVDSIAKRMGTSKNTALKAQAELLKAGWVALLEDSKGRNTKTWQLFTASTVQDVDSNRSPDARLTVHPMHPKKEDKQEGKKEVPANADTASKLIAIYCEEYALLKSSPYKVSGKDAGQAKLAAKANPGLSDQFRPACQAYLKDAWAAQTGFTLSAMLSQLNKWVLKADNRQNGVCQHTDEELVEARGTAKCYRCKSCKLLTWR